MITVHVVFLLLFASLVLRGGANNHATNVDFVHKRCIPTCTESDLDLCLDKLLSISDTLAHWRSYESAAQYSGQAVSLASSRRNIDRRFMVAVISVADNYKRSRQFRAADAVLSYALQTANEWPVETTALVAFQAAVYEQKADVSDCQSDSIGALFAFEQAMKLLNQVPVTAATEPRNRVSNTL